MAGAGSGKKRGFLTHRIAYLIEGKRSKSMEYFWRLRFTNKVAKEMKERVNKLLENGWRRCMGLHFSLHVCKNFYVVMWIRLVTNRNFTIIDPSEQKNINETHLKRLKY